MVTTIPIATDKDVATRIIPKQMMPLVIGAAAVGAGVIFAGFAIPFALGFIAGRLTR